MRDEFDRLLEDTTRLRLNASAADDYDLVVDVADQVLRLSRGDRRSLHVELANHAHSAIDCRLDAVAPLDAWPLLPSPTTLVTVPALSHIGVDIPVVAGATCLSGQWWVLVKAMWFGQRHYSRALSVEVSA
jgi:alpha-mannosidase